MTILESKFEHKERVTYGVCHNPNKFYEESSKVHANYGQESTSPFKGC